MLVAIVRAAHPGPAITVTVVAVLLGVAAGLDPVRIILLGLATAFDQLSVGLSNDWLDAERDRGTGRRDKPVALGQVSATAVRAIAISTAVAAILVTIPLGLLAVVVHTIMLGSAWAYNLGLKRTAFSVAPYIVSFGLIPVLVTVALPVPALPAWWAVAAAALLGIAAHFANVLPDLEDDRRTGISGLPHRLPHSVSLITVWVALVGAAIALAFGIGFTTPLAIIGLALSAGIAVIGLLISLRTPSRWGFRLVLLAALIDVALLVAAGTRLLAH